MLQIQRYEGSPDRPVPPSPAYWRDVAKHDPHARARAASLLGALPPYHFVDERGPAAIYRFYSYETPLGVSVSALRRDLEDDPRVFGGGTLGQTDPNFVAPSADQVAANPPGATLADAANALLIDFSAHGVPSEHVLSQSTILFQTAWNADPLGQLNGGNSQLEEDGSYGPNAHDALASISGGTAPTPNTAPAPPNTTPPKTLQTTPEPVPQVDSTCAGWGVDTTNAQAAAIAGTITFHDSPTAWADQGVYNTTINGAAYRFVMWWENGLKAVAAYRCSSGPGAGPAVATASAAGSSGPIILGVLFVGGLVATGFAARKPIMRAYHRRR